MALLCCITIGPLFFWWGAVDVHDLGHGVATKDKDTERQMCHVVTILGMGFFPVRVYQAFHRRHHTLLWQPKGDIETRGLASPLARVSQVCTVCIGFMCDARANLRLLGSRPCLLFDLWCALASFGVSAYLWPRHLGLFGAIVVSSFQVHVFNTRMIREHHIGLYAAQHTMSCYSPVVRWLTRDMCLHVEHHDFPMVPVGKVHLVYGIAPEFYDPLLRTRTLWEEVSLLGGRFPRLAIGGGVPGPLVDVAGGVGSQQ
jgi:fatty acid desaturase